MSADDLLTTPLRGLLKEARRLRSLFTAVTLGLGALSAAIALPVPPDNTVYGNVGTTLYTITPSTGAAVSVGSLAFTTNGFGRDPITGRVYYAEAVLPGRVAYWDPTTGTNTILPTALGFATNRMGFRADGQMFSMNPSTNNIYVIDRNTGNPAIVATVNGPPLNGGGDMAFAPNGDLYIVTTSTIFRVLANPIPVPAVGAIPALATTSGAAGAAGSPTGLTFIDNGVALGSPSTGIIDIGLNGGTSNARGANSYSDLGSMPKFADIAISVTPSSPSFARTGSASYAVSVSNNGPQSASGNFSVMFTLPTGVTLVGAGPFGSGWSCVGGPAVTCTNTTASLVVGASLPTLSVSVTTSVAGGTNSLSTTFAVADTTFDTNTANNTTTVLTSVGSATISKGFLANPIATGGSSTLMFTLSNPTATAFTGVSFTDTLPTAPAAMLVAAVPNASTSGCGTPTFTPAAGNASLAFSAGSIAAGGTCTVRVDVTAPASGNYNNTGSGVVTTQTGATAGAASNTASLLVMTPPTIAKSFSSGPVIPNGPSTLTITLSNPAANGGNAITGANFTDVFPTSPGAMTLADTTITNGCGGTLSDAGGAALAAGSTALKLVGGTVPAGGGCVITVNVRAPTAGTYNNTTGVVGSANAGLGAISNTASVVVQSVVAPSIAKDFSPTPIAVGATSTLTFTITNPNPTTALTGVSFSDTFPSNPGAMTVAATPAASTTGCGAATFAPAANAASLAFSTGSIAAGGTCTVKVNITVNAVGAYTNVSGAVTSTGPALTGNTATANLATLAPPVAAKAFSPTTIGTGSTSTVTITISNPNGSQTISGVALTDVLPTAPGAMKVAAIPNPSVSGCGAPTFAPLANAVSAAFSNGTIVGGGLCTIKFDVVAPAGGTYPNTTGAIATANSSTGVAATASLTVVATAPVSITKSFLTTPMAANVPAVLRFVLTNPNTGTALSGVAFSDSLPTSPGAMVVAAAPGASTSGCGAATFAPVAGAASVSFTGGAIPASGTCTVDVKVSAPAAGTYANTTSSVTSTTPVTTGAAALANVDVLAAPGITKTFLTSPVAVNVPTTLRFDIANPNGLALANLSFTDLLPSAPGAMMVAPVPNATTSAGCTSPSFTPSVGATSLAFSTASIAAGATCRVSVDVVVPVVGSYVNTSSAISSTNGGSGNTASATLSAVALNVPTLAKSFASAGPIAPGTPNALTLTLGNGNASAITLSAALIDNLPAGMTVASPANSSGSCVGVTATPGDTKITLASGSSIPAGGCSVIANVVANTGGTFTNTLAPGALATSAGSNAAPASASFNVPFAPAATKSFTPSTVAVGATSVLKISLVNSNGATAISGAAFTDTYPAGLVNTAAPAAAISGTGCSGTVTGAANGTSLALAGGVIPAGGTCDISVNVTSATAGNYLNSSGAISTSNVGTGNASSATLTVSVGAPLTVAKSFIASTVAPGATSVLRIRLTNPNGVAITGATFNDAYPAGLVNTPTPAGAISGAGCTGSVTAGVNGTSLALAAGNIPASSFCDITANVTSNTPGSYANSSGTVATSNGGTAAAGSATLVVLSPPTVVKGFAPSAVSVGGTSVLKITVTNANTGAALAGVAFTDTYPFSMFNTAAPAGAISGAGCSGTVTAAANGSSLALSAGNVPASSSCDITVNVTSAAANTYVNSSGAVTTTNAGTSSSVNGTLVVLSHVTVLKAFTPASVSTNAPSVLKITLTNPNAVAITGAAFTDAYPGGLVNTATPAGAISGAGCSGTVTAAAGGASLAVSAGNVPAGRSCDITVNVTSAAAGSYVNNSGAVSTANAGAGASSGATLTVTAALLAPGVSKTFTPAVILTGDNSLLRVTITNPNALAITGAAFTDNYPATLSNTSSAAFNAASAVAGCSGTITGASGTTSLALTNGNIPVGVSCMVDVNVTSNSEVPVLLTNPVFSVSSTNAPSGNAAAASLQVLVRPTIAKSFTPSTVLVGGASTLSLVITNPNPIALSALAFTDTFPANLIVATVPNTVNGCGGTFNAAAGAGSVSLSGGSLAANQSCTLSVAVSSAAAGAYSNTSGGVSSFETGAAGAASNTAVLTVNAPSGVQIEGSVYSDSNHNLLKDGGEAGTGLTLYAKLVALGAPAGPASQAAIVGPATGAYLFTGVAPGEYVIVINGNATLSDVTPAIPATWTGTEAGDQVRRNVVVAAVDLRYLNFGLFNGNPVTGRVFRDNGSGGGTPNNAVQDGTEAGIGQVAVRLTNAAGTQTYDATTTDAAGNYRLWVPSALTGNSLRVVEDNLAAYRSVGGAPAGSYDRAADAFTFTYTVGSNPANLNFADVAIETLTSPQRRTASHGEAVFYAHTFTPGTGGSVTLSASSSAGWAQTLLRDANCNGVLDAGEGVVSAPVATTAGTPVCVIARVLVPTGAAVGAQDTSTLQAVFSYSDASPSLLVTLTNDDLTTVGGAGGAGLALVKSQDNATPLPGGRIVYTITYTNQGSSAITAIRINDATPAFTRFVSAACVAPLAAGLSACSVTASPAAGASGAIEFTLTGALLPSASGQVSFSVDVASGP